VHNNLRDRWEAGDPLVHAPMQEFRELTTRARAALLRGDHGDFGSCIDENFELRRKIMALNPGHLEMVETARECGATAHYAGSGGTIVGTCGTPEVFASLREKLGAIGCALIKPEVN
jgi:glucuronokinase